MTFFLQSDISKDMKESHQKFSISEKYNLNPAFAQLSTHSSKIQWRRRNFATQAKNAKQNPYSKIVQLNFKLHSDLQQNEKQIYNLNHDDKHLFYSKRDVIKVTKPVSRQLQRNCNHLNLFFDESKVQQKEENTEYKKKCNSERSIGLNKKQVLSTNENQKNRKSNSFNVKSIIKKSKQKNKDGGLQKSKIILSPQKIRNYQFNAIKITRSFTNQTNLAKLLKVQKQKKSKPSQKTFKNNIINPNNISQLNRQTNLFWRSSAKKLLRNLSQRHRKDSNEIKIEGWNKQEQENVQRILSPNKRRRYFEHEKQFQEGSLINYTGERLIK